jgi:hypothetical protein
MSRYRVGGTYGRGRGVIGLPVNRFSPSRTHPYDWRMDMHENRARYEAKLSIARSALTAAESHAVTMGMDSTADDINSMILTVNALMRESLERQTRKPLRGQLTLPYAQPGVVASINGRSRKPSTLGNRSKR